MNVLAYVHLRNIVRSTGAGRVARQMTECLAQQPNMDLRILADPGDHRQIVGEAGAPWTGFQYYFFENETSRQQARWYLLRSPRAEHYWPEADIVYCTGESYVPAKQTRLVVTLHDAAIFEQSAHRATSSLWKQRMKWKLLYGALDRNADMFHTVSQFSADRLAHFFPGLRSRLRVVPNAVAHRFFQPVSQEGEQYLTEHGWAGKRFVLLPGGLRYRKNAELVLSAWPMIRASHPELCLVVVNHSNPAYMERASALGAGVEFAGFVSDEQLCSLYHAATVVWFPSRYEGFGMPALEAMACGAPVVASNSSSLPEVCGKSALLPSAASPEEHCEAVRFLLENDNARHALRAQGRQWVAQFTWARSAGQLRREFESLL